MVGEFASEQAVVYLARENRLRLGCRILPGLKVDKRLWQEVDDTEHLRRDYTDSG